MTMVSWVGAGIEVAVGMHVGKRQWAGRMSGDAGALPGCEVSTLITQHSIITQH